MKRLILLLVLLASVMVIPLSAQTTPATVEITGMVEANDGTAIIVAGLTVNLSELDPALISTFTPGTVVTVTGQLQNTTVVAVTVVIIQSPEATEAPEATEVPEATPEAEVTETPDDDDSDDDSDVIIVIEGPVESINVNVVVIYGFEIELDDEDARLSVIQVGDILRIEGDFSGSIIIAVTFVFIDIDVFVLDGVVWRDYGNCNNPPPPWAVANGWRNRCENNGGGSGRGSGRGSRRGS